MICRTTSPRWARDYEAAHVYMGEHPNVTIAAIRGGDPWRLSRNPYACSLYLDIRTVPGQTVDGVKRDLRRVLRAFADRTGTAEPALHVYVSDPPVVLDENLPIIQALGAAQAAGHRRTGRPRSSAGPAPMPCISRPMACRALHSDPAGECIPTRAAPPCMPSASMC